MLKKDQIPRSLIPLVKIVVQGYHNASTLDNKHFVLHIFLSSIAYFLLTLTYCPCKLVSRLLTLSRQ